MILFSGVNMIETLSKWKVFAIVIFLVVFINPASSQSADDWLFEGHALYNLGEFEKAIEAYDRAIAIDPNFKDAWLNKGVVHSTLGEYQKAIEAFNKGISIDPNYKEAWLGKGIVLNSLGRYDEANEAFDKTIAIDPSLESVWAYKGISLYGMGRYKDAVEALDKSIAQDPYLEETRALRDLAIKKMAEQPTATTLSDDQEESWVLFGGVVIVILICITVYIDRAKNKDGTTAKSSRAKTNRKVIGIKFLDEVFNYTDGSWGRTLVMGILFSIPLIMLYINLMDSNFSTKYSGNKVAVAAIGLPAFWITRRLYWLHRRNQILALIDANENVEGHVFSIMMTNPGLHEDLQAHRKSKEDMRGYSGK